MKKLLIILNSSLLSLSVAAPVWSNSAVEAAGEAEASSSVTATTKSVSVDGSGSMAVSGSANSDARTNVRNRVETEIEDKTAKTAQLKSQAKAEASGRVHTATETKAKLETQGKTKLDAQVDATMAAKVETQAQAKAQINKLMTKAGHGKAHIKATLTTYESLVKQGLSNQEAYVVIQAYLQAGADVDAATDIAGNLNSYIDLDNHVNVSHDDIVASFSALSDAEAYISIEDVSSGISLPNMGELMDTEMATEVNAEMSAEASGSYDGASAGGAFNIEAGSDLDIMR